MQRLVVALALLVAWDNLQLQTGVPAGAVLDARAVAAQLLLAYLAAFWLQLAWPSLVGWRPRTVNREQGIGAHHQARSTA